MLEWGVKKLLEADHFTPSIDRGRSLGGVVERGGGDICYYKLLKRSRDTLEMRLWSRLGSGTRHVRVCMKVATRVNEWILFVSSVRCLTLQNKSRWEDAQEDARKEPRRRRTPVICDLCDDPSVESKDVWERVRTRVGVHATSAGHSSGQTADDAVKGPTARNDDRSSPNNAFIARMVRSWPQGVQGHRHTPGTSN